MITVDALREYGANTAEGLERCMNNEAFYLRFVNMALEDKGFDALKTAIEAGDKKASFEAAHALKGLLGNLSLTPIYDIVVELTERLRAGEDADYEDYLRRILEQRDMIAAL